MDDRGRIYYHQFITSAEIIQNQLGIELNCAMSYGYDDRECCRESIELYSRYKHLINDINQTSITRNILRSLFESIYLMMGKISPNNIIRFDSEYETYDIIHNRYYELNNIRLEFKRRFNDFGFGRRRIILSKMVKKRRRRKEAKKRYLEGLTSILLPHDMENIIISFCI